MPDQSSRQHAKKSGFSLTITLAVSIGLLVTIAVGSVLLFLRSQSQEAIVDSVIDRAGLTVDAIVDAVDRTLLPAEDQAVFIADLIEDGWIDPDDRDDAQLALLGSLAPVPQVLEVGISVGQNRSVAFQIPEVSAAHEGEDDLVYGFEAFDVSETDPLSQTIQQAVRTGRSGWSPVQYDTHHDLSYLAYIVPFEQPSGAAGAVYSAVSIVELSLHLEDISTLFEATAFILDAEDWVIAHPNLVDDTFDLSEARPILGYRQIGDPVLAGYRDARPDPGMPANLVDQAGLRVLSQFDEGPPQTYILTEIDGYGGRSWIVGSHFPSGLLTGGLKRIQDSGYLGGVMLIVSLIVGILLARRVARPIRHLASNAAKIGSLDLRQVERLPSSRISELNDQANAFNAMVDGLKWFERYVPRTLVQNLIGRGEDEGVHSVTRDVTVLFTDLVGFTSQSEAMTADETATMLNHHFALLSGAIEAEDGTIDKFIGDALMAFWGAPQDQPDHADRAVRAGLAMVRSIIDDNTARRAAGKPEIRVRIGIHSGPVVVGNIGAPGRMNYTIVGDTVNAGQRLESLGKEVDPDAEVTLLISGDTRAALTAEIALEKVGAYHVKGRSGLIEVWRPHNMAGSRI